MERQVRKAVAGAGAHGKILLRVLARRLEVGQQRRALGACQLAQAERAHGQVLRRGSQHGGVAGRGGRGHKHRGWRVLVAAAAVALTPATIVRTIRLHVANGCKKEPKPSARLMRCVGPRHREPGELGNFAYPS